MLTVGEGDIFGEWAMLFGRPRAANVVCWREAVVWELDKSVFWAVVMKNPKRWEELVHNIFRYTDSSGQVNREEARQAIYLLSIIYSDNEISSPEARIRAALGSR